MAQIAVRADSVEIDNPVLIEGLPGIGLVGKITVDHLVESLDMTYFATVHCDGIPPVAVYREGSSDLQSPVRIYAAPEHDLLALQSDVPVSPSEAPEFVSCLTEWLHDSAATPVYLSGKSSERDGEPPSLYGVSIGSGAALLEKAGIDSPSEDGLVRGPTGALLHAASDTDLDSVGLIVESNPQFPDPEAARVIINRGIGQFTDIDVNTDALVDQAEEIQQARQQLAHQMQKADDESTQAQPLRMFQ